MTEKKKNKLITIFIAIIPAVLAYVLIVTEPFYSLDTMLCDLMYSRMNGTGDNIKIIAIDEETLAEYGPLNEWSREKSAELIDYLYKDENAKPLITAFDIMFIGEGNKEVDDALAKAAAMDDRNIITATNLVYRGTIRY